MINMERFEVEFNVVCYNCKKNRCLFLEDVYVIRAGDYIAN